MLRGDGRLRRVPRPGRGAGVLAALCERRAASYGTNGCLRFYDYVNSGGYHLGIRSDDSTEGFYMRHVVDTLYDPF